MEATWLCPSQPQRVLKARTLFMACIVCGLMQKPLIKFAWDVQTFLQSLTRVHSSLRTRGGGACALLGGTAILLRQVFATKGQRVVAEFASSLAVAGKGWSVCSFHNLSRQLEVLEPRHHMKRRGRMVQFSGPKWIRQMMEKPDAMTNFGKASVCLGTFLKSTVVKQCLFHDICKFLKSPAGKLFHVGDYSVPHLVRACWVGRAHLHGDGVTGMDADAWMHLRNMHDSRTKGIFDTLAVHSFQDALALENTVREMAPRVWSASIARHYASVSIVDLPCQACEFGGVLGAVERISGGGEGKAIDWLLRHLPADLQVLKGMGLELKRLTGMAPTRGDGLDTQAAGAVAAQWLKRVPEKAEGCMTLQEALTRGSGGFVALPKLCCPGCDSVLLTRLMGRKRKLCDPCYKTFRKYKDSGRYLKRRRRCRFEASVLKQRRKRGGE